LPKGQGWRRLRAELGGLSEDEGFTALFSSRGRAAGAPWGLALVSVRQYAEGRWDRQAAGAVCSRLDGEYGLALELTDPGSDAAVLGELRARVLAGQAEARGLDAILPGCGERQLLKAGGRQRTDSRHVLAAIGTLTPLETVGTTRDHALNALAAAAPDRVRAHIEPAWGARYSGAIEE